jgi:hypothetical protein
MSARRQVHIFGSNILWSRVGFPEPEEVNEILVGGRGRRDQPPLMAVIRHDRILRPIATADDEMRACGLVGAMLDDFVTHGRASPDVRGSICHS